MKINEKHLIYLATCPSANEAVVKGWLNKKNPSTSTSNFQKRWCVLKGNLFFYFEKKTDKEPLGLIILENCSVQLAEEQNLPCSFSIQFAGKESRILIFAADNDDVCTTWVKALSKCSCRYLDVLVKSLENDVKTLQLQKKSSDPQIHLSNSCGDLNSVQAGYDHCENSVLPSFDAKSSSYNNILDAVEENDRTQSQSSSLGDSLPRAKSSSDITSLGKSTPVFATSVSVVKLKSGKAKQKRTMIQKLSPKLTKSSSKNLKHTTVQRENLVTRARAEALVPVDEDFLVFEKMHKSFGKAIAQFVAG